MTWRESAERESVNARKEERQFNSFSSIGDNLIPFGPQFNQFNHP